MQFALLRLSLSLVSFRLMHSRLGKFPLHHSFLFSLISARRFFVLRTEALTHLRITLLLTMPGQ